MSRYVEKTGCYIFHVIWITKLKTDINKFVMRKLLGLLFFFLLTLPVTALAQGVDIKEPVPNSPAELEFEERVKIRFTYYQQQSYCWPNNLNSRKEKWLSITPFTAGKPTPNAVTSSDSKIVGTGSGEAYFSVRRGKQVQVDSLRIRYTCPDRVTVDSEYFVPVDYTFSSSK